MQLKKEVIGKVNEESRSYVMWKKREKESMIRQVRDVAFPSNPIGID